MTRDKDEALRQLARALGVPDQRTVPRELAARALGEILAGHANASGLSSFTADIPKPPPPGSALAELEAYRRDQRTARPAEPARRVEPSDDMQRAVDIAVSRALAKQLAGKPSGKP